MKAPYYESGGVTIYHDDCREILPEIEVADHLITDPPYSEYVHSKSRAGGRELGATGYLSDYSRAVDFGFDALTDKLRHEIARFSRKVARWSLVFSDVESCHLWRAQMEASGRDYVRTCIWHKLASTPQFTGDRPAVSFETITLCHAPGRKRWNAGGKAGFYEFAVVNNIREPRIHPTQKPLPLMLALVRDFTDPGDLIIDPCAGSGTTGVAAQNLGRRAILIELDESSCETMAKRFSLGPLFEPKAEQGALV